MRSLDAFGARCRARFLTLLLARVLTGVRKRTAVLRCRARCNRRIRTSRDARNKARRVSASPSPTRRERCASSRWGTPNRRADAGDGANALRDRVDHEVDDRVRAACSCRRRAARSSTRRSPSICRGSRSIPAACRFSCTSCSRTRRHSRRLSFSPRWYVVRHLRVAHRADALRSRTRMVVFERRLRDGRSDSRTARRSHRGPMRVRSRVFDPIGMTE